MRRLLACGVLVAAAFGGVASAAPPPSPGGYCDGKVDVMCREYPCVPGDPCTIEFCGVWYGGRCLS